MDGYFPYIPGSVEHGSILAWRMPLELSQSCLGGRTEQSSACTLIALKLAELLYRSNTRIRVPALGQMTRIHNTRSFGCPTVDEMYPTYQPADIRCPSEIIQVLTEAIISGNDLHEKFLPFRFEREALEETDNFTIPDALAACGHNFEEVDFCAVTGRLWTILPRYLKFVINNPALKWQPRLFFMMIAFERCILLVYDRYSDTVSLFDTHMHRENHGGSIVAFCEAKQLRFLADWMSENIFPESVNCGVRSRTDHLFELSLLTFRGPLSSTDCVHQAPAIPCFNLFETIVNHRPKRNYPRPSANFGPVKRLKHQPKTFVNC